MSLLNELVGAGGDGTILSYPFDNNVTNKYGQQFQGINPVPAYNAPPCSRTVTAGGGVAGSNTSQYFLCTSQTQSKTNCIVRLGGGGSSASTGALVFSVLDTGRLTYTATQYLSSDVIIPVGNIYYKLNTGTTSVSTSSDGISWTAYTAAPVSSSSAYSRSYAKLGSKVFFSPITSTSYYYTDGGGTWVTASTPGAVNQPIFMANDHTIYMFDHGTADGYKSTDGINWTYFTIPVATSSIPLVNSSISNSNYFVHNDYILYGQSGGEIYVSYDDFQTWEQVNFPKIPSAQTNNAMPSQYNQYGQNGSSYMYSEGSRIITTILQGEYLYPQRSGRLTFVLPVNQYIVDSAGAQSLENRLHIMSTLDGKNFSITPAFSRINTASTYTNYPYPCIDLISPQGYLYSFAGTFNIVTTPGTFYLYHSLNHDYAEVARKK